MKKKLNKKLVFSKSTIANLDASEQSLIRGGYETDPASGCQTVNTYCQQATCNCPPPPTSPERCESIKPAYCDPTSFCM